MIQRTTSFVAFQIVIPCTLLLAFPFLSPEFAFPAEKAPVEEAKEVKKADCACDKSAEKKDPKAWDKTLSFGFNLTDGNSNTVLLNSTAKIAREYKKDIWRFEAAGNYGEDKDSGDDEDGSDANQKNVSADGEYKHLLSERWYAGFGVSYLYDDVAEIDYRVILKPTIGYFLLKTDSLSLSVDVGPGYVFERVGREEEDYFAPRFSNRLDYTISKSARIFETTEYLINVEDSDAYIVNAEAGIEAAINSYLSLVISLKNAYDNTPADDKERNDFSMVTALQVTL